MKKISRVKCLRAGIGSYSLRDWRAFYLIVPLFLACEFFPVLEGGYLSSSLQFCIPAARKFNIFPLKKDTFQLTNSFQLYTVFQNLVPEPHLLATREDVQCSQNPGSLLKRWGSIMKKGGRNGHCGTKSSLCSRIVASSFALR